MAIRFLLTFFCIYFVSSSIAQNKKIDSLLSVSNNYSKSDSQKVVYLSNIFRQYCRQNDLQNMELYIGQALALAKKLPQTYSLSKVYEWVGLCYHGKAKYLQAIEAYKNGIDVGKKRNDKMVMAGFYLNLGALYGSIPDYNKSLEAQQIAVALYTDLGDTDDLASCYMNLGDTYNSINNPVLAVAYIKKALAIFKTQEAGLHYGTSVAYKGIANSHKIATENDLANLKVKPGGRYKLCLLFLDSALRIAKTAESANPLIGSINKDIGAVYEEMGNKTLALTYYQYALQTGPQDEIEEYGNLLYTMGQFYFNSNDVEKSRNYLRRSLALGKEAGLLLLQKKSLEKLSVLFEKRNIYDSALIFYKESIAIKDSIFNTEKEKEITRKQLTLDFSIKENDYRLVQQVSDSKLKQQNLQISFDRKVKIFLAIAIALVLGIAGLIFYDRRKTKKLNAVINSQKAELEKLSNVKDKIFSVVSHDIRAPVNSLISFINILEEGNLPPEKLTMYAKSLKQSLGYTSSLMNNLLTWAASQMQGFKPTNEKIDALLLISEVASTLQHHWEPKNISLNNLIEKNTFVYADENMLAAVLRNLISNAIKFSHPDTAISISAEANENFSHITIQDEGIGMQAAQLAAFNADTQSQTESTRGTANEKGTGLGLLLCKTFMHQMGGTIKAVVNDKGTSFVLFLPHKETRLP